jgi:large subunit ribosomal protein L9
MKVLLLKDVYKLGHAGDIKKVADGYGRNFLLPQGLAALATPGALRQVDRIREQAAIRRAAQNEELSSIAAQLNGLVVSFAAKAGETGKLYGSITAQDLADAIEKKSGFPAKRQQVDLQPIRSLGDHVAHLRLTMDLIPEIKVVVYREGEADPTQPHVQAPPAGAEETAPPSSEIDEASEPPVEAGAEEVA